MLQAIKNFFKREQHTHHHTHNSAASCCTWMNNVVLLLPSGECYIMAYDHRLECEVIRKIRLGY